MKLMLNSEAVMKDLFKEDISVLSWPEVVARQTELYNIYAERDPRLLDKNFALTQMAIAIIDEYAEYQRWGGNPVEQMFEAIDLFHFALEALIILESSTFKISQFPQLGDLAGFSHTDDTVSYEQVVLWFSQTIGLLNWKHWKTPVALNDDALIVSFRTALRYAVIMFNSAFQSSSMREQLTFPSDRSTAHAFFKCYTLKARENERRQKEGY